MMHGREKSDSAIVSWEADEQSGPDRKAEKKSRWSEGRGQGECEPAKHGPGPEPGNVSQGAGAHTESREGKEEGEFIALFHHISIDLLDGGSTNSRRMPSAGVTG